MTFLEDFGIIMHSQRNVNNIGMALKTVLQKAKEDGRLVCGVYECAQMLQNLPEDVCLCLLPDEASVTEDVTANIQQKLVEAFCWENDIEVVKVDSLKKLGNFVSEKVDGHFGDVGCVLIKNAKTDESATHFIDNYYSLLVNQSPVVHLPD